MTAPIHAPTTAQAALFSTSSAALVTRCPFDESLTDRCAAVSHCGSDLRFPDE